MVLNDNNTKRRSSRMAPGFLITGTEQTRHWSPRYRHSDPPRWEAMRVESRELLIGVMDELIPVIVEQLIDEGRAPQ